MTELSNYELCQLVCFCCHNSYVFGDCGANTGVCDEMPQFKILRVGFAWGIMNQAFATIRRNSPSTSKGVPPRTVNLDAVAEGKSA